MGKSGLHFVKQNSLVGSNLHNMRQFSNTNVKMKLLKDHDDTFLFHQLQNDASTDHAIRLASYFNKQTEGFRIKDI